MISTIIYYTGIGASHENYYFTPREFINIINSSSYGEFIPPVVDENNYTYTELMNLVDWCGAEVYYFFQGVKKIN